MRRALPPVLALLLGVGAALLVACGGGTKSGIPAASAGELKSQITDVQQAVDDGRCEDLSGQLRQVDHSIGGLPSTVDARLRRSLRDASDRLHETALSECKDRRETTQTQTTSTETQTQATETQTSTLQTQTVPTQPSTTPPPTTTRPAPVPTTTSPPAPPAEPPAPPPGTPSGGASPEVPR